MEDGLRSARRGGLQNDSTHQTCRAKLLAGGLGGGGGAGGDSAAAAVFSNAPEEILEFGPLLVPLALAREQALLASLSVAELRALRTTLDRLEQLLHLEPAA